MHLDSSIDTTVPPDRRTRAATSSRGLLWRVVHPRGRGGDVLSLAVIGACALLYLSPALVHGPSFGPTDEGRQLSVLTAVPGPVHNSADSDIISQGQPWNAENWQLIHQGEFPLWNPLSGNGMPQFLNFESGTLAVPSLVGYLFPLGWSFLASVFMKLLIAGFGVYLCCRLLGTSRPAATFGGITFMLSGPVTSWLGWSISGVFVWTGFVTAGIILAYRGTGRTWGVAVLGGSVAAALYGGFPEGYLLLGAGIGCLLAATAVATLATRRSVSAGGCVRVAAGTVLGAFLAAPLWLPGLAVLGGSARGAVVKSAGLPSHQAGLVLAQGYCGIPISGSRWLCTNIPGNYYESAAYVGIVAVVLALLAVIVGWWRPVVVGMAVTAATTALIVYRLPGAPVQTAATELGFGVIDLARMLAVLAFALAILASFGFDVFVRGVARRGIGAAFVVTGLLVLVALGWFWLDRPGSADRSTLIWPAVIVGCVGATLLLSGRRGAWLARDNRIVGLVLLVVQTTYLMIAGIGINSYGASPLPMTPALAHLRTIVGSGLLGLDAGNANCVGRTPGRCGYRSFPGVGLYPEMNVTIGLPELAVHDPTVPATYLAGWPVPDAGQVIPNTLDRNFFAPDVDSVRLARVYGVTIVEAARGARPPSGMTPLTTVEGTTLFRVPRSGRFTIDHGGTVRTVPASQPDDNQYDVTLPDGAGDSLTAHITDVPGWTATTSHGSLSIHRNAQDLMVIDVPPGTTHVVLRYFPKGLVEGTAMVVIGVASLLMAGLIDRRHQRRLTRDTTLRSE